LNENTINIIDNLEHGNWKYANLPHLLFYGAEGCGKEFIIQNLLEKIFTKKSVELQDTEYTINDTTDTLAKSQIVIEATKIALPIAEGVLDAAPTSVAGVPILFGVITKLQKVVDFLNKNIDKLSYINATTLAILTLLKGVLTEVLALLKLLDILTQYCYPNTAQEQISTELTALTIQQSTQTSPVVIEINGFKINVETEATTNPLKRRRAIATNKQNVVMLKGEWSFSSIDQILIDELIFYIQQNNLKAD
jgi:DNA polymerase III delta prime subunit